MNSIRFFIFSILLVTLQSKSYGLDLPKPEPSQIKALSFIALAEPLLPNSSKVREIIDQRLGTVQIDKMETDDKKVILFRIHGGTVMVGLIDAPLPQGEIDFACKWAWQWPKACDAMKPHKAHLIVSVLDTKLDKVDAALLQTHVVHALMDSNAIASYWAASLQSKETFLKQSLRISREDLPVLLWINFNLSKDVDKGWTISTQGLNKFNLYEIESKDVKVDTRKLFSLVTGMADYLLRKGPVIKDGETIGDSPSEKIRVQHASSYWNAGKTVYRVVFP